MSHKGKLNAIVGALLAVFAVAAVVGMSGPSDESGPLAPGGPQEPAKADAPKPPTTVPRTTFASIPGWLGFAAVKAQEPSLFWSPKHPTAAAVIFGAFAAAPTNSAFLATSFQGTSAVTYQGPSAQSYGCGDDVWEMAEFTGEKPLPEGPVWIVSAAEAPPKPLPIEEKDPGTLPLKARPAAGRSAEDFIAYEVGGIVVTLEKTGPTTGDLKVFAGDNLRFSKQLERQPAGEDREELGVRGDNRLQVPVPIGGFQFSEEVFGVVLWTQQAQGNTFDLLEVSKFSVVVQDGPSQQFCAR